MLKQFSWLSLQSHALVKLLQAEVSVTTELVLGPQPPNIAVSFLPGEPQPVPGGVLRSRLVSTLLTKKPLGSWLHLVKSMVSALVQI